MLHQVQNRNSYVCNDLDLDALWDFLFETGFIYPKKYALIHANKEQIKQTYQKLYTRSPEIARHFVYQENGVSLAIWPRSGSGRIPGSSTTMPPASPP